MSSNVYSFLNVQCALVGPGGVLNLGNGAGAAEEGISIDPSEEINTMQVGADGQGQHSLHANKSGRITVRLLKTSPVNQLLGTLYALQTSSAALHGQNTITISDKTRGDAIVCRQVAFTKAPPLNYGKEAGLLEWEFSAIYIDRAFGS
jgi:hypothetical protein